MKVNGWLKSATKQLETADIGTARLDCLVLLEDALGKDRSYLLANPDISISTEVLDGLDEQIERRSQHIPLSQIRGKTEFYGREFIINEHVLEPRPESETMIDLLLELELPKDSQIVDVGTGSGALGITAKLGLPEINVMLVDIDQACLAVAKKNAKKHTVVVEIIKNDLLPAEVRTMTVLANLPYVPENYQINQAAMNEPRLAIFGGKDGLDVYRRLFEQITNSENKPIYLCCESLPFQHETLKAIAQKSGYKLHKEADFIQVFQKA